jgi:predicted NodU family carbamoyl transferase
MSCARSACCRAPFQLVTGMLCCRLRRDVMGLFSYMSFAPPMLPAAAADLPAIVHTDMTARLQACMRTHTHMNMHECTHSRTRMHALTAWYAVVNES